MKFAICLAGVFALIVLSTSVSASDVYKVVRPDGSVVYTDRKTANAQSTERMRRPADSIGISVLTPGEKADADKQRAEAVTARATAKAESDSRFKRAEAQMLRYLAELGKKRAQYEEVVAVGHAGAEDAKRQLKYIAGETRQTEKELAAVRQNIRN
jgi:hypothetical protein